MKDPAPLFTDSYALCAWLLARLGSEHDVLAADIQTLDLVLLDDDRSRLLAARAAIEGWLARERGLTLNPKLGQVAPATDPAMLLGHRVSRAGITPAGRMRRRMQARISAAAEAGPRALERTLASYRGLMWVR